VGGNDSCHQLLIPKDRAKARRVDAGADYGLD
jgi:hypothetical protein